MSSKKIAVVIYNLGGPDRLDAVKPFLFNLFNDPLIIRQPGPLRWLIAKIISTRRAPVAREIYEQIGGSSPILDQTNAQATALQACLDRQDAGTYRVFVSMRYWHPLVEETVAEIKDFDADEIILLPLYPQFSTSTTESFLAVWEKAGAELSVPVKSVCCYPRQRGFVESIAQKMGELRDAGTLGDDTRILFSAHGLPQKFVDDGDPYQHQVEQSVAAIVQESGLENTDYVICYQSRVGPMQWLTPYTDAEIQRAGAEKKPVIVVPVAFVSEHSETLVELDIEYRALAEKAGVPSYHRVATVQDDAAFIEGLADMVIDRAGTAGGIASAEVASPCGGGWAGCPLVSGWKERLC